MLIDGCKTESTTTSTAKVSREMATAYSRLVHGNLLLRTSSSVASGQPPLFVQWLREHPSLGRRTQMYYGTARQRSAAIDAFMLKKNLNTGELLWVSRDGIRLAFQQYQ